MLLHSLSHPNLGGMIQHQGCRSYAPPIKKDTLYQPRGQIMPTTLDLVLAPLPPDFQTFLRSYDFFMMSHDASKRDFFNVFIDTKKSATYNYIKANRGCARSWILIMRFTVLGQA